MEKIYCGNAKTIETKYGEMMKLSFTADDLKKMQDNLDNGWVNVAVNKRKEVSKGGMTHYCQIDTWKPTETKEAPKAEPAHIPDEPGDELPF